METQSYNTATIETEESKPLLFCLDEREDEALIEQIENEYGSWITVPQFLTRCRCANLLFEVAAAGGVPYDVRCEASGFVTGMDDRAALSFLRGEYGFTGTVECYLIQNAKY